MVYPAWATVVALIPGSHGEHYVAVTTEYKQGNRLITPVPPSGVPNPGESIEDAGRREFKEEIGVELTALQQLGPPQGYWDAVRKAHLRFVPYLGTVKTPVERGPSKLDENKYLKVVLFPIEEYLKVLEGG